ncbi:uncharacterized protein MCYG_03921 [Microsporum canis CBS 113480]|uniref:Uncharacterized protein n=1 Tax=Arthroderma otae (strain ATCC MYA-4605 / CBS 113480) TaxID=554155 RepID=C5FMJ9_ARTOC|nr:uncharacterized protein MCYG_03921 [Microsporum canis CBS 113480]EEQ31102.1 predicted protein [Microsporum canis CBS 113480]
MLPSTSRTRVMVVWVHSACQLSSFCSLPFFLSSSWRDLAIKYRLWFSLTMKMSCQTSRQKRMKTNMKMKNQQKMKKMMMVEERRDEDIQTVLYVGRAQP